ncbi:MAG TPA: AMP-binding protein, partial [Bradyrhizobium sp.]|nr:AMP-binding protein [Bradyrhizobium sp.]
MTLQAATISDFERAQRRLRAMAETDPQIARAVPLEAVTRSVRTVGIAYREIIANTLAGYAERPALGTRTFELRPDSDGHHVRHYLPSFTTITFRELARRIEAIASVWQHHPRHRVGPGDFVAFIAFASAEMVAVDLACAYAQAIAVPLQANLTASDMNRIFADTHPVALVATIENLELAAGYAQRHHSVHSLVVIDAEVGDEAERKRIGDVRRQLRDDGDRIALASFAEIIELGARGAWTPPPRRIEGQNALMMLMYTSGSTGTPKGAMIHETMCNQLWSGISSYQPSIQVVC